MEVREINIRQHFINDSDDVYEIPLVQITHNFVELYPQQDDENVCVLCKLLKGYMRSLLASTGSYL